MTTIGQNIRKLRKERGMTQEELAEKVKSMPGIEFPFGGVSFGD